MAQPIQIKPASIARGPVPTPGKWRTLFSAPHRTMFAIGVAQIVLAMMLWFADLGGRYALWWPLLEWAVPPMWAHAFLMVYTVFPLFVFGFALTAMPNWTASAVAPHLWRTAAPLLALGLVFTLFGLRFSTTLAGWGVLIYLLGWTLAWIALAKLVIANRARDKHSLGIVAILAVGALGVSLFAAGLLSGDWTYAALSRQGGLWLFLLPLFMVVSHRLVPFFSSRIIQNYAMYRPRGSLAMLILGCGGHFLLESFDRSQWTWLVDFPMAAWVAHLAWRWGLSKSFRARLLTMLHLSLAALAVALMLYGIASLAALFGHPGALGYAPLHALAIGYFTAKTVAMVSRVSLGHSGRALEADKLTWRCFVGVMIVAALRVLSDFDFLPGTARTALLLLAAALWIALLTPWSFRYGRIYFSPRADGKAG